MHYRFSLIAAAVFGVVASSFANLTFVGTNGGESISIDYFGNSRGVFAGRLEFTLSGNQLFTYCVDLDNTINGGQSWACWSFNTSTQVANLQTAGHILANSFGLADTAEKKAGLQIALWEAMYDGLSANLGAGDFQVTSASANALTHAATYSAYGTTAGDAIYYRPEPIDAGQGQIGIVPEPATMAAIGIGLAALARRRRK